jgi:outer membrane protein assembly factor BamD (BamD/ComL family)
MGAQRIGPRQHVFISIACLILSMVAGCITINKPQVAAPDKEGCDHFEQVEGFIRRGDFEGAAKASQDVLSNPTASSRGDEALLNLGLISAHYANPKKDYKKALGYFMRVEREFPQSSLVDEAKIWESVLRAFERAKQVDLDIQKKKMRLDK